MRKRWGRRLSVVVLLALVTVFLFSNTLRARLLGWLHDEPFYDGLPASYWTEEMLVWLDHERPHKRQSHGSPSPVSRWIAKFVGSTPPKRPGCWKAIRKRCLS